MKTLLLSLFLPLAAAGAADFSAQLAPLLAVGPEGKGNVEATAAWKKFVDGADASAIPGLLTAMNGANDLSANWLRGAVSTLEQRAAGKLPLDAIKAFAADTKNGFASRALAFDLIRRADKAQWEALVPGLLNDPCAELRREPVSRLLEQGKKNKAAAPLRQALEAARDDDQIKAAADALRELGEVVDLPKHFGFLMDWKIIGPFDNRKRAGYETAFHPEIKVDLPASYDGRELKAGEKTEAKWVPFTTGSQFGMVDFNKAIGMYKDVTGYAFTEFNSPVEGEAEIRIGCKNAWKLWVNGAPIFGRDEYHRGAQIDQYRYPVKLKKGPNAILMKCCQNEQTETWTVEWEFQLRVCDATGTAILATDRKPTPPEALKASEKAAQ